MTLGDSDGTCTPHSTHTRQVRLHHRLTDMHALTAMTSPPPPSPDLLLVVLVVALRPRGLRLLLIPDLAHT
jgi:hypothetical protein